MLRQSNMHDTAYDGRGATRAVELPAWDGEREEEKVHEEENDYFRKV